MKNIFKKIVVYFLTLEARAFLARFKPTVIAVTGTVGKTSAKDAIAAALAPFAFVRKSEKSYNSDIGVPLAILGEKNQWNNPFGWLKILILSIYYLLSTKYYPRFLVLEVGTDMPGDIRAIVKWLKPHVVVVTKLSRAPVHVENFASVGELIAEKGALVSGLRNGGALIVNADDTDVLAFRALAPRGAKIISFGFRDGVDVRADEFGSLLEVHGTLGTPPLYAALAGLSVAKALEFDLARAARALSKRVLAPGRMRLLYGINGARIIDDTY
ncbi:MAG: UDP-N-acetylmuramoyl-tripeptide--D-alanyl-D-alanine ligase, partial [Parcubacteria group bacterium Gr01-1014_17]